VRNLARKEEGSGENDGPSERYFKLIRLTCFTRKRVFGLLKHELNQRLGREEHRHAVRRHPGRAPAALAPTPPLDFKLDAVLQKLADSVSEEGAFLVRETEFGGGGLSTGGCWRNRTASVCTSG